MIRAGLAGVTQVVEYQAENLPLTLTACIYPAYPVEDPGNRTVLATLETTAAEDRAGPAGKGTRSGCLTIEVPNACRDLGFADAVAAYVASLLAEGAWISLATVAPGLLPALQACDGRPRGRKPAAPALP